MTRFAFETLPGTLGGGKNPYCYFASSVHMVKTSVMVVMMMMTEKVNRHNDGEESAVFLEPEEP